MPDPGQGEYAVSGRFDYPASSIEHPVSSIEHPVSSIEHPVSSETGATLMPCRTIPAARCCFTSGGPEERAGYFPLHPSMVARSREKRLAFKATFSPRAVN